MKFLVLALCIAVAAADPTPAQYTAAKASWETVKNNQVDILYAVFKANPDIQEKFTQFAGKNVDDIKGTPEFKDYAGKIVGFFSQVMDLLGNDANTPKIVESAKGLGKSHKSRASPAQFDAFRKSLATYLKGNTSWNADVESSWNSVLDYVFGLLKKELSAA